MRACAILSAILAAIVPAGCTTPQQPPPPPELQRPTERAPGALPDAYKHPPK
jgi:hypothetical protein